jgi:hypothetical protein
MQRLGDVGLTARPACCAPCEHRVGAVALGGTWSLSESGIKGAGVAQNRKACNGVHERTVGTDGPEHLFRH